MKNPIFQVAILAVLAPCLIAQTAPNRLNIPAGLMTQVNTPPSRQTVPSQSLPQPAQLPQRTMPQRFNPALQTPQSGGPQVSTPKQTNDEQAFDQVKKTLFPLTNAQILELRKIYNSNAEAKSVVHRVPPKPISSAMVVNLEPGATPPVVRLSAGFVTSLIFLDATGAPWPIRGYDIGDPQSFSIKWKPEAQKIKDANNILSNTLLIQSNVMYKQGNLAVILQGLNTPIMLTLVPGQKVVDYRVDVQVPRNGPMAHPVHKYLPSGGSSPELLDVLNHIAPKGSRALKVKGGGEAWIKGSTLYLRTKHTVISPSWYATMSSSDGAVHAYALPPTSIVLGLNHGKTVKLSVGGI